MTAETSSTPAYRFGDTAAAAERLRILAEVFEPSSRELLASMADRDPRSIVDLGCGPGHATRLLAQMFPRSRVTGVDSSAAFVELARALSPREIEYLVADVTSGLPLADCDLIYCRYLLTHVPRAQQVIEGWADHLQPAGAIVIEENEWIETAQPDFARYMEIVAEMLLAGGQKLYLGAELAGERGWSKLRVVRSEVVPIPVSSGRAAAMFALNIANWKSQPYIVEHFAASEIETLERNLHALVRVNAGELAITFGRRRLILERRAVESAADVP